MVVQSIWLCDNSLCDNDIKYDYRIMGLSMVIDNVWLCNNSFVMVTNSIKLCNCIFCNGDSKLGFCYNIIYEVDQDYMTIRLYLM